jgi:hypothetical protein
MAEGHVFRYSAMLSDPGLAELREELKKRMADSLTTIGIFRLLAGKRRDARESISSAMTYGVSLRSLVAYSLACCGPIGTTVCTHLKGHVK